MNSLKKSEELDPLHKWIGSVTSTLADKDYDKSKTGYSDLLDAFLHPLADSRIAN